MMLMFLFCLVLTITAAEEFENGLHYNYAGAYAPEYHNYAPRDYHFDYFVSDPHTGDHKSQWEVKQKGVVKGGYSLVEPDGSTRVVEYIADDNGFRAIVKKLGNSLHPDHVEAHGFHSIEESHPHAYDGKAENYANVISEPVIETHGYNQQSHQHNYQEDEAQIFLPEGTFSEEAHGFVQKPQEILPLYETKAPHGFALEKPQQIVFQQKEPQGFILEKSQPESYGFIVEKPKKIVFDKQPVAFYRPPLVENYHSHGDNHNVEDDPEYSREYDGEPYGPFGAFSENVQAKALPAPFSLQPKLVKPLPYHFTINHSVQ